MKNRIHLVLRRLNDWTRIAFNVPDTIDHKGAPHVRSEDRSHQAHHHQPDRQC